MPDMDTYVDDLFGVEFDKETGRAIGDRWVVVRYYPEDSSLRPKDSPYATKEHAAQNARYSLRQNSRTDRTYVMQMFARFEPEVSE